MEFPDISMTSSLVSSLGPKPDHLTLLSGCQMDGSWGAIKQPLRAFPHHPVEGAGMIILRMYELMEMTIPPKNDLIFQGTFVWFFKYVYMMGGVMLLTNVMDQLL